MEIEEIYDMLIDVVSANNDIDNCEFLFVKGATHSMCFNYKAVFIACLNKSTRKLNVYKIRIPEETTLERYKKIAPEKLKLFVISEWVSLVIQDSSYIENFESNFNLGHHPIYYKKPIDIKNKNSIIELLALEKDYLYSCVPV